MDQATHNKIVSFIWGIADDVLHDLFKRGSQQQLLADFTDYLDGFSKAASRATPLFLSHA